MNAARHALITGGSSGIGFAVAKLLAAQGWRLSLIARGRARLESSVAALRAIGGEHAARHYAADVAERAACLQAVNAAVDAAGAPDLLLACAGTARRNAIA